MLWILSTCLMLAGFEDEIVSGPEVGKAIPALKALQVVGDQADKQLNWADEVKGKPTILVFVRSDKWDRPVARVVKQLDDAIHEVGKTDAKAQVGIIWVSNDVEKAKEYLPKAAQSMKLQASSWNSFQGEVYDATGWQLSGDGAINVVIIKDGKTVWGRGFATMGEGIVRKVMMAYRK